MLVLGAFAAGLGAGALLWRALQPTFALPLFARTNHRGRPLPTAVGLVLPLAVLGVEALLTTAVALGVDLPAESVEPRRLGVLVAVGFALLGLLDDLGGAGQSGGFRGHLRSLARGELTTGGVKLLFGAALSVVVVAASTEGRSLGRLVGDAALVALAANLANLLDRAPGRVLKSSLLAFAVLLVGAGAEPDLAGVALLLGAAAALLLPDVRERAMLGDTGANVVGAALGLGVVLTCSPGVRLAALVSVAALNLVSEVVSFSRVIDATPPLRWLDRAGRPP